MIPSHRLQKSFKLAQSVNKFYLGTECKMLPSYEGGLKKKVPTFTTLEQTLEFCLNSKNA